MDIVGWTHSRNPQPRLRSLALALTLTVGLAVPIAWAAQQDAEQQDTEQHTPADSYGAHAEGHPQHGHHGDATKQRFDDIDKAVEMFENTERDAWQKPDEVLAHMQLQPGDVVADIGAGTGYFTRRFAEAVGADGRALGLDVEASMVAYMNADAQQRGLKNYTARQVQPSDPQLDPQSMDVIFICDTYHHIPDRVDYVRTLASALRAGGRVIIVDFNDKPAPFGPPAEWKLSAETITQEFQQAGLQLARSVDFLPYQYFLEFTRASTE